MSDSNRSSRDQTVASLFEALALIGAVVIAFATGSVLGVNTGRDQVTAREHYERAKQDAMSACPRRQGLAPVKCITEAIESAQAQSDSRQDLYAQQDMSKWAWWMLVATAFTVAITALGVWFIKRTLDATLTAVEDTGKGTKAMLAANEITRALARPWVTIECVITKCEFFGGKMLIDGELKFRNVGKYPAIGVTMYHKLIANNGSFGEVIYNFFDLCRETVTWQGDALLPNETFVEYFKSDFDLSESEFIDDDGQRGFQIMVAVAAQYKSRNVNAPNGVLQTARCFNIMSKNARGEWDRGFNVTFERAEADGLSVETLSVGRAY